MVNTHNKTFFGIDSAILIRSDSKQNPYIFLKGFQKKEDGTWEKPSTGEGKTIKLSLEEIISLLHILRQEKNSWKTKHDFKERRTEIVFKWIPEEILNIAMNNYSIKLEKSQVELLEMLLDHILKEKIIYATSLEVIAEREFSSETQEKPIEIEGIVEGSTEKAIRINFGEGKEVWIPKSTIHSDFKLERGTKQTFIIDSWVLNRKEIL